MDRELTNQSSNKVKSPEDLRLEILNQYQTIDAKSQAVLDGLTQLAANLCQTPNVGLVASESKASKNRKTGSRIAHTHTTE
jgi:hypothetical protein